MSSFARYFTALAVVLAVGLVSVGCVSRPKKAIDALPAQPDKAIDDASTTDADPGDVDVFVDQEDDSARAASEDVLGVTEEEPEVELEDEEVEAPEVDTPKAGDIEDM